MPTPSGRAAALLAGALFLSGSLIHPPSAHADDATAAATPSVAAQISLSAQAFTLANGLRVLLAPDATASRVSVRVAVDVGRKDDPHDARGMSEVIERLLADPSTRHVPREIRANLFSALGISEWKADVEAAFDSTSVNVTVPPSDLALALWFESDRLGFFLDGADDQEIGRKAAAVVPSGWEASPVFRAARATLFGDEHPYGGRMDLSHLELGAVRAHIQRYFVPRNTVLAVAGNFEPKAARKQIEEMFGPLADTPKPTAPSGTATALTAEKRISFKSDVPQPILGMAWATPAYLDPEDAPFDILSSVLAERLASDLVRGSKVATQATVTQASMRLGSVFFLDVRPAAGHSTAELEPLVDAAIEKLRSEGPTAAEGTRASRTWLTSKLTFLTRTSNQAYLLSTFAFTGHDATFLPQLYGRYEALSAASLLSAAKKYLARSQRVTMTVTPSMPAPASAPPAQGGGT